MGFKSYKVEKIGKLEAILPSPTFVASWPQKWGYDLPYFLY